MSQIPEELIANAIATDLHIVITREILEDVVVPAIEEAEHNLHTSVLSDEIDHEYFERLVKQRLDEKLTQRLSKRIAQILRSHLEE